MRIRRRRLRRLHRRPEKFFERRLATRLEVGRRCLGKTWTQVRPAFFCIVTGHRVFYSSRIAATRFVNDFYAPCVYNNAPQRPQHKKHCV